LPDLNDYASFKLSLINLKAKYMKVKDVMITDIITVKKEATYKEVAVVLTNKNISGVLVVDDAGKLIGVVSEKDLFKVLYPYYQSFYETPEQYLDLERREDKINEVFDHKIESFMTKELVTISPDAPIMEAGSLMLAKKVHRLPVVDKGKLIGLVTRELIYRAILNHHLDKLK
jgi:CBS domain-containing protein